MNQAQLAALTQAQLVAMVMELNKPKALTLKVSEKGAVSIYGMGRFPITLYRGQLERLLDHAPTIRQFIETNAGLLAVKA